MKFTIILPDIKKAFNREILDKYKIENILHEIYKKNGKAFLVGGAVRDLILSISNDEIRINDIDIEVHGISLSELEKILKNYGTVNFVGKIYGILKIHNINIDWSIPRIDSPGRKPDVKLMPNVDIKTALQRRDLTINAMAYDIKEQALIDPFNGFEDLQNKTLRSPDLNFFIEDPLRFYRVMSFVGRFEMTVDDELNKICSKMDIKDVSIERVQLEFEKLFLKSRKPSLGIRWLEKISRLKDVLPELKDTIGIKQEKKWHPEGDVFEHTMQSLDAAAKLSYEDNNEKLICMYAILCHDLGKVSTTREINGKLRSHGHDNEGEDLTKKLLSRITRKKDIIKSASLLVRYHMQPLMFKDAKLSAYKRLALKLNGDCNLNMLALVAIADRQGRNGKESEPLGTVDKDILEFIKKSKEAKVFYGFEKPILHGKDIISLIEPGKKMGELLKAAYQYQLDNSIQDKDKLINFIKRQLLMK